MFPSHQKRKKTLTVYDSYYYLEGNDNPNKPGHITKERYQQIMDIYADVVIDRLKKGEPVKLFNRLGSIRIMRYKHRRKLVDFNKTKEFGKNIYHENLEHGGYFFLLYWQRWNAYLLDKTIWKLILVRTRRKDAEGSILSHIRKYGLTNFLIREFRIK
jgi:hypothetical protein